MRRSFVILLALLTLSAALPASAATVRDLRDTYSIPHIFGSTDRDVLYALGRAHARDRSGDVALADLRHLLKTFAGTQGQGALGVDFFADTGAPTPDSARDLALLQSELDPLAGDPFAPASITRRTRTTTVGNGHRIVFDHTLGGPFNIPPNGGFPDLAPDLPGLARASGFGTVDAATHDVRAASTNAFLFGSGPTRRFMGALRPSGPMCEEVIPSGERSGVPDQLPLWLINHDHRGSTALRM